MKKMPFCNFTLAGVSLNEYGLEIPSPFTSLELSNSEIQSMTSWVLNCIVKGDSSKKSNIAAFEALLYSAAQSASNYPTASGVPVSFIFGWLDDSGNVEEYLSYQGFTLKFDVSTDGTYMRYKVTGFASLSVQSSMPVLRIPELSGIVQPSAVVEALARSVKATSYYDLDIDHNDAPTYIYHGPITTSFNRYVRGTMSAQDDFDSFPGLLPLSKSYNGSREAGGLAPDYKKLSQVLNNSSVTPVKEFLRPSNSDMTPQCSSFSYWVDEPTMTQPGIIHYKSNSGLQTALSGSTLEFGTSSTNVFSINGSYNGISYNMSNMSFSQLGFSVDSSGSTISQEAEVVNSWSSSLADVFQTANIMNDINAIASQFSGDFTVTIPGSLKQYGIAQPVSLVVMSGGTLSPISGIYNIISVTHSISSTFITTLKLQRLVTGSANQVASSQGIYISGTGDYPTSSVHTTKNVHSTHKVDFGIMYPTFEHMSTL